MNTPLALAKAPREIFDDIRFIFTDLDDTLTTEGALLPETYQALHHLKENGFQIVPVTGGCAGWCDQIARIWPVAGVIGENGAFYIRKDQDAHLSYHFWDNAEKHRADQAHILETVQPMIADIPTLRPAFDQAYRLVDVAIDYNQDCSGTPRDTVQAVVSALHAKGINAVASSIHINAWLGDFNKAAMTQRFLTTEFGLTADQMKQQVLYSGDAPNDEPMFRFFPNSVGVANITPHLNSLENPPAFITTQAGGRGFAELVNKLLSSRKLITQ